MAIHFLASDNNNNNKSQQMPNESGQNCAVAAVIPSSLSLTRYFHLYLVIRLHVRHQNFRQSAPAKSNDLQKRIR